MSDLAIEVLKDIGTPEITDAVIDFDGNLSLLRDGWQDIMVPHHIGILLQAPGSKDGNGLIRLVRSYIDESTGQPTMYHYLRLVQEFQARGGLIPQEFSSPEEYAAHLKEEYAQAMLAEVRKREEHALSFNGGIDSLILPCSKEFLEGLKVKGVRLNLASGTDNGPVNDEARFLGLDGYFESMRGALPDYKKSSKRAVMEQIIEENHLKPGQLLVVGDSPVEIRDGVELGAITIGVCTKDNNSYGMNQNKEQRLREAGAHVLVPDYRNFEQLLRILF